MKTVRRGVLAVAALPVQLLVLLLVAGAELASRLRPRPAPAADPPAPSTELCSIVLLSWNGRHLLEESLPAVLEAVRRSGRPHQVLVADNGSEDDTLEWLAAGFPEVDVLALEGNLGFGEGNNRAVAACRHDIVVLLNNDMIVQPDFLKPLLEPFGDSEPVFAVTSQIDFPEGRRREETGNTQGHWSRGYLELSHEPLVRAHHTRRFLPVLWAGGGSSAFDRRRFEALGGFASVYSPCYFEDTELSYRAWRRGWRVLLAAESRVVHRHRSSTSRRFTEGQLRRMLEERRLLYVWRNFDLRSLFCHLIAAPADLLGRVPLTSYLGALRRLPGVLRLRAAEPRRRLSDRRLLALVSDPFVARCTLKPGRSQPTPDRPRLLMVSAYLPHEGYHGGAGRVRRILEALAERFEVTLATFTEGPEEEKRLAQVESLCRHVVTVPRGSWAPVSPFPYEPFEEFNSPAMRRALQELLAEEDFDCVDFEWTQMAQYADLFDGLPSVLTEIEVNWAAHRTRIPLLRSRLARFHQYYRTLQTLYREVDLCRRVDCVVCVTDNDRSYLKPFLPGKRIEVVNTGVDTGYFDDGGVEPEPGALLYVGAFRHDPNVDAVLHFYRDILPLVRCRGARPHLYIVGAGPGPEVRSLAADPDVTVTGYVEDIREYYRRAEIVIVPLRTGVGIRGKVLEAWSMRRPVVATPLACQGLEAEHGGNVLLADSAEGFARWVVSLMAHPEFGRRLAVSARRSAEARYSWDVVGRRACAVVQQLALPSTTGGSREARR